MTYTLPKKRFSNVTILGAISNIRDRIFFHVGETTNILNVKELFKMIEEKISLS
jgi:hypothetical protein